MLTFHKANGGAFISLLELYLRLGHESKSRFYTWRMRHLHQNITLEKDIDYLPTDRGFTEPEKKGRPRQDYLITIPVAIAICINSGTVAGRNTKKFIEKESRKKIF